MVMMPDYTKQDIEEAKANGISYSTFYQRIMRYNYNIRSAKTKPTRPKQKIFNDQDRMIMKKYGVPEHTAYQRYRAGMDKEEAMRKPLDVRGRKKQE